MADLIGLVGSRISPVSLMRPEPLGGCLPFFPISLPLDSVPSSLWCVPSGVYEGDARFLRSAVEGSAGEYQSGTSLEWAYGVHLQPEK